MMRSDNYVLTKDDLRFLVKEMQKNNPDNVGESEFFYFLKGWSEEDKIFPRISANKAFQHPMIPIMEDLNEIFMEQRNYRKGFEFARGLIENDFEPMPHLELRHSGFFRHLAFFSRTVPDNFIQIYQYFKNKNIDILDEYLSFNIQGVGTINQSHFLNSFISTLKNKHVSPNIEQDKFILMIKRYSRESSQHMLDSTLSLFQYVSQHPEKYDLKPMIDVFATLPKSHKSFGKAQNTKFLNLVDFFSSKEPEYFKEIVEKIPEFKKKLLQQETSDYEEFSGIFKSFKFDWGHLSKARNDFPINKMKLLFSNIHRCCEAEFKNNPVIHHFNYESSQGISSFSIQASDSTEGLELINHFKIFLNNLYESGVKGDFPNREATQALWDKQKLAIDLDKTLPKNEERKKSRKI